MTIQVIKVRQKDRDVKGEDIFLQAKRLGLNNLIRVEIARIFRLEGINKKQAIILAKKLFCEGITQKYALNKPIIVGANFITEVAYKPGVMNPETASIIKSAKDLGINIKAADSSTEYCFFGKIRKIIGGYKNDNVDFLHRIYDTEPDCKSDSQI